jgi:hypothetical protein
VPQEDEKGMETILPKKSNTGFRGMNKMDIQFQTPTKLGKTMPRNPMKPTRTT